MNRVHIYCGWRIKHDVTLPVKERWYAMRDGYVHRAQTCKALKHKIGQDSAFMVKA